MHAMLITNGMGHTYDLSNNSCLHLSLCASDQCLHVWYAYNPACTSAGKVFDRMSKGIREAPGKALIGDLAAESGDRTEGAFGVPILCNACMHGQACS